MSGLAWERAVFDAINALARAPGGEIWAWLTHAGHFLGVAVWVSVLLWPERRTCMARGWKVWAASAVGLLLVVRGLKWAVARPRPVAMYGEEAVFVLGPVLRAGSFPSGHTATAVFAAWVVCGLTSSRPRRAVAIGVALMAGFSRVVVGAHHPLDVLAGAALGSMFGGLALWLSRRETGLASYPAASKEEG